MEIALFGGSFDPPHVGHVLAAAYVLSTEPVDELWLVPVFQHPLAKKLLGSFELRVALCERAIEPLRRARVSRVEEELKGEGRTVDLLEHLQSTRPADRFSLVLGSDLALERPQWKRFDRIVELARLIQIPRRGFSSDALLPEVSSSQVRALLANGADLSSLLPRGVLELIRSSGSYLPLGR